MGAVILRGARQAPGSTEEHPVVKLGSIRLGVTLLLRPPPPLVGLRGRFSVHGHCIPCMPPRSSDTPRFWMALWIVSWIPSSCLPRGSFLSFPSRFHTPSGLGVSVPSRQLGTCGRPWLECSVWRGRVSNKGSIHRLIWLMGNCFACRIPGSGSFSPTSILALLGTIERRSRAKAAVGAPQTSSQNPPLVVGDRIRGSPHTQRGGRTIDRYVSMQREKGFMCGSRPSSRHGTTGTSPPSIHL